MNTHKLFFSCCFLLFSLTIFAQTDSITSRADTTKKLFFNTQFEPGSCMEYAFKEDEFVQFAPDSSSHHSATATFRLKVLEADSLSARLSYRLLSYDTSDSSQMNTIKEDYSFANDIFKAVQQMDILIRVEDGGEVFHIENWQEVVAAVTRSMSVIADKLYPIFLAEIEKKNAESENDNQEEIPSHHDFKNFLIGSVSAFQEEEISGVLIGFEQVFAFAGTNYPLGEHSRTSKWKSYIQTTADIALAETTLPNDEGIGYKIDLSIIDFVSDNPVEESDSTSNEIDILEEKNEDGDKLKDLFFRLQGKSFVDSTAIDIKEESILQKRDIHALFDSHFFPQSITSQSQMTMFGIFSTNRKTLVRTAKKSCQTSNF